MFTAGYRSLVLVALIATTLTFIENRDALPQQPVSSQNAKGNVATIGIPDFILKGTGMEKDSVKAMSEQFRTFFSEAGFDVSLSQKLSEISQYHLKESDLRSVTEDFVILIKDKRYPIEFLCVSTVRAISEGYFLNTYCVHVPTGEKVLNKSGEVSKNRMFDYLSKLSEEIIEEISAGEQANIFFKSLLIPGLGQFTSGHKLRGLFYPLAIGGVVLVQALLPDGDPYGGVGDLRVDIRYFPDYERGIYVPHIYGYYIGNQKVSEEEFFREQKRRNDASQSRAEAARKRRLITIAGISTIYLINVVDAILISRKYSAGRFKGKRFSFQVAPDLNLSCLQAKVNVRYHF